jgi:hypothetical protein
MPRPILSRRSIWSSVRSPTPISNNLECLEVWAGAAVARQNLLVRRRRLLEPSTMVPDYGAGLPFPGPHDPAPPRSPLLAQGGGIVLPLTPQLLARLAGPGLQWPHGGPTPKDHLRRNARDGHPRRPDLLRRLQVQPLNRDERDQWPDHVRLSDIANRFVCTACGKRGADVRGMFPQAKMGT